MAATDRMGEFTKHILEIFRHYKGFYTQIMYEEQAKIMPRKTHMDKEKILPVSTKTKGIWHEK